MSYTVREERGCTVVEGRVPLDDGAYLLRSRGRHGHKAVMDFRIAETIGAVFVIGSPEATDAWRRVLGIESSPTPAPRKRAQRKGS